MGDRALSFRYTRHGRRYWSLASVFLGLVLVEGGMFIGLSLFLIRDPVMKWSAAGAVLAVMIGVPLAVLLAPLFTRHRLTPVDLILRYGWHAVAVPRSLILAAVPVHESLAPIHVLRARTDETGGRAVACFSEVGQIALTLAEPVAFPRSRLRPGPPVDRILFNVDDRAALLAELGVSTPETEA